MIAVNYSYPAPVSCRCTGTGTCNCTVPCPPSTAATASIITIWGHGHQTAPKQITPFVDDRELARLAAAMLARTQLLALTAPAPPVVIEPKSFTPVARPRPASWLTRVARRRA